LRGEETGLPGGAVAVFGFWAGLAGAIALLMAPPPAGLAGPAWIVAALSLLMAIWWVTEALPLAATALLPLIVLPLMAGFKPVEAAAQYANPILFLLLGGFLIAIAIERWGLSQRIAYTVVAAAGPRPRLIVAGFMAATAFVSMWISNTATAMMMIPLAVGAAAAAGGADGRFATALVLGVGWAATIGGIATPIGSPTNIIALSWMEKQAGVDVAFLSWMAVGVPVMIALLLAGWVILARTLTADAAAGRAAQTEIKARLLDLGSVRAPEARTALIFASVAALWISSQWITKLPALKGLDDTVIALIGALALCMTPAGGGERRALLTWKEASAAPWGIILLFGGGLQLADAATKTGLAAYLGGQLSGLSGLPVWMVIAGLVVLIIAITELASNVATITLMLPILAGLVSATGQPYAAFIVPAAIAASTGFMMPIGSAANAITYATGLAPQGQMIKLGLILNIVAAITLVIVGVTVAPVVFG
jgi:sodium-dependent dicarboxylate transporter 2/3/5